MAAGSIARMMFRQFLPTWIDAAMNPAAIVRVARGQGLGFRYQTMLDDIRLFRGLKGLTVATRAASRTQPLDRKFMVETDLRRREKYWVIGKGQYQDKITGSLEERPLSFYTDSWLSPEAWEEEYKADYDRSKYDPTKDLLKVDIESVLHNEGISY